MKDSPRCNKQISTEPPTNERCNEMIDGFEHQIGTKFSKLERNQLIGKIKLFSNHFWEVRNGSVFHFEITGI